MRLIVLGLPALVGVLLWSTAASAQTISLKRDVGVCAPSTAPLSQPDPEGQAEARRLVASANQAGVLGDQEEARDLLTRAAALDPTADHVAYLLGRTLEELGETEAAVIEYCRYLALEPDALSSAQVADAINRLGRARDVPDDAVDVFLQGIEHFDADRLPEAERAFGDAVARAPRWATAYYNRAVTHLARNQDESARRDLVRYLELEPDASDREQVAEVSSQLARSLFGASSGQLFLSGLVPGVGYFRTGRPVVGMAVAAVAAGAVAYGIFKEERTIECLTVPVNEECPESQVRSRIVSRPHLGAAIGVAAGVTLLGAFHASRGAAATFPIGEGVTTSAELRILPFELRAGADGVGVSWLHLRF